MENTFSGELMPSVEGIQAGVVPFVLRKVKANAINLPFGFNRTNLWSDWDGLSIFTALWGYNGDMAYDSVLTQFKTLNHLTLSSHQTPFDHRRSHLCQLPLRRSSRTQILVEATLYIWTGRIIAVCCAFCILANDLGWRVTSLCQEKNPGARFGQGSPWVAAPGTSKAHQSTFVPTATWCNGMAQPRYKVGQNLQLKPGDTCYDISYDSGSFTLPSQTGPSGVWPVPNSGRRLANTLTIIHRCPGARPRFPSDQDCQIHPNIQYVGAVGVPQITEQTTFANFCNPQTQVYVWRLHPWSRLGERDANFGTPDGFSQSDSTKDWIWVSALRKPSREQWKECQRTTLQKSFLGTAAIVGCWMEWLNHWPAFG